MEAKCRVSVGGSPCSCIVKSRLVASVYGRRIGLRRINHYDRFSIAYRPVTPPQGLQRREQVRFVVARNHDREPQARAWRLGYARGDELMFA